MSSNCAILFLFLATCNVVSCGFYSIIPPSNPYPSSGFCNAAMSASYVEQPTKECCNQGLTGTACCTQLFGKYSGAFVYYYSETSCRCSSFVSCKSSTTTTSATTAADESENDDTTTTTVPTTTTTTVPTTTTTTVPTTTTTVPTTTTTVPTTTTTVPTTTTTVPTTTTTVPTTTTTVPTTTTTVPTTTTTVPTTTTTVPTTTTTVPTTTTTTVPTTTEPASLCPPLNRLLNANPVINNCTYSGVGQIHIPAVSITSCNAVYTVATINNVPQYAFVTAQGCTDAINDVLNNATLKDRLLFDLNFGTFTYPIDNRVISVVTGSNGLGYLTVGSTYTNLFDKLGCQAPACVFDQQTMLTNIDYTDCTIASYGSTNADTRAQTGLNSVAVTVSPFCNNTAQEAGVNVMCFRSISGDDLICSGDAGAPVYCKAKSNGEDILMGVAGTVVTCGGDGGYVPLIPVSS